MNASPTPQPPAAQTQGESLRETFDSIVIALILAFVFRAFIIEAFVIPTGSMASTLNGAHGTMICHNCGWEFAYGLTDPSVRGGFAFDDDSVAECPNCRMPNRTDEINDRRRNCESGDRILVLKWTYDIGGATLGPHRWDVVVFKDPSDGVQNYIKRLAGLPNEVLEIVDGDVYTADINELSEESRRTLDDERHIKYLRREWAELERTDMPPRVDRDRLPPEVLAQLDLNQLNALDAGLAARHRAMLDDLDTKLQIRRKTDDTQRDLWRVVFDLDYPPRELIHGEPQWIPQDKKGWSVHDRTLRFADDGGKEGIISLAAEIDSLCAYNTLPRLRRGRRDGLPVSDLRISYVLDYRGGNGTLAAELSKRNDHFRGELAADGTVRLLHATADAPHDWKELATASVPPLVADHKIEFAMQNLEYRVGIWVNGQEVLATTDEQYAPNVHALRTGGPAPTTLPPRLVAQGLDVELSHVLVQHDIFYISQMPAEAVPIGYHAWGVENYPIWLRSHEFFMLGDNSAQSKDSRLWNYVGDHLLSRGEDYQLGTVPRDQLIGRAFFVYWPSGLRTSVLPFLKDRGWIPNFGRMRWIR
ncbi:MAG TPA: S26 family signal peptidase [Phycisphaerae bacterium]|mgnify:CR=1 FL=1|nr:S26 family signal peptidase [Phycisphaerae bacterium]